MRIPLGVFATRHGAKLTNEDATVMPCKRQGRPHMPEARQTCSEQYHTSMSEHSIPPLKALSSNRRSTASTALDPLCA